MLENKIDFMVTIEVREANANGDPLSGNMPRTDAKGHGLISDVAIKRKIRNRMQDFGHPTFVQAGDRIEDEFRSLEKRFSNQFNAKDSDEDIEEKANKLWLDVRSFGQSGRSSDTMGMKYFVDYGVYLLKGSINPNFAEKTGFSAEDVKVIKQALVSLFENDASSARPEGSMRVREVFWFTHSNKLGNISSARVFDLFEFDKENQEKNTYEDYGIHLNQEKLAEYENKGLKVDILEGL